MFQSNAFQSNAFQTVGGVAASVLLGGKDYPAKPFHFHLPYEDLKEADYKKRLAEKYADLKRIDEELSEAEKRKLAAQKRAKAKLLAENAAKRLAVLEVSLQEEINVLRIERVRLMRLIDDEEAVLALLLSWPLH